MGNSLWLLMEKGIRWTLGLTVGAWTARYLGPADFGVLSATAAWVGVFTAAAGFGIEPIVLRELIQRPSERASILATAFGLRCIGGAFATGTAILAAWVWPQAAPPQAFVAIFSLVTLFSIGEVFDLWFQASLQARAAALTRASAFAIACVARAALIIYEAPISAFVWLAVAEAVLTSTLLSFLFRRVFPSGTPAFSIPIARALLRESWPNLVSNIAAMGYIRVDRIMLASLDDESGAGIYSAASSLIEMWHIIPFAIVGSATPLLTRLYGTNDDRYMTQLSQLARTMATAGWLLFGGLAASSAWLVPALFGLAYTEGSHALALLAACLPFTFLGIVASPWYLNERLSRLAMQRHLLGGCLNVVLNYLFIPRWGICGAAIATLIGLSVVHVFANGIDRRTRPLFRLQLRALSFRSTRPL